MATPLRVLILADQPADAEPTLYELRRVGVAPVWERLETEAEYLAHLDQSLDIILADYHLPQFDALRALQHFLIASLHPVGPGPAPGMVRQYRPSCHSSATALSEPR